MILLLCMEKTLVIFTYAPAGLGHLRVADALMETTPEDYVQAVFSPSDPSVESMHRFTSLNVVARHIAEWVQRGTPQEIFTTNYIKYLKGHAHKLILQFTSLIRSQPKHPDNIIVVATHFGLAHQLGAVKQELETILNTKIFLIVQVTDDSPQYIWYVENADLLIVPGADTKVTLEKYAHKEKLSKIKIEVVPYPITTTFSKPLSSKKYLERADQYDPDRISPIHIVMPVSGAAVGMEFFEHLMEKLRAKSPRFVFHVVCRKAPFTENFIKKVDQKDYVQLYVSESYSEVVRMYNCVYLNNIISAEVTKPSEQSFKALLNNNAVGGSFLFFAKPVGRQEYDNLEFLKKHGFTLPKSKHLRGRLLPLGSRASANFIWNMYNSGSLLKSFNDFIPLDHNGETGWNGAERFWKVVRSNCKL